MSSQEYHQNNATSEIPAKIRQACRAKEAHRRYILGMHIERYIEIIVSKSYIQI